MVNTPTKHKRQVSRVMENKNTNWVGQPGAWFFYGIALLVSFLAVCAFTDPGTAWSIVNISHSVLTFYFFHWTKGSPLGDDQGKYHTQTFWEQMDDGLQNTNNRKFFTLVPVVLYLLAAHTSRDNFSVVTANTVAMVVSVIAKMPFMHGVRLLGINKW